MLGDSKNSEISLEGVLCLLDRWRHLPAYQLERRADILFALFLPEVLEKRFGISNLCLIPEFPIKKSLFRKNDRTYQSINVDYLAVSADLTRGFLIELKTDMMSIDKEQVCRLKCASRKGIAEIVCGLKSIVRSSSVTKSPVIRGKYYRLLKEIERLGLICISDADSFERVMKEFNRPKFERHVCQIKIGPDARKMKLDVLYVIPKRPKGKKERLLCGVCQLYFECIAAQVESKGSVGSRFAKSLKNWEKQAGLCHPG